MTSSHQFVSMFSSLLCGHDHACSNTIKALNWYGSVREKLDDPKYASWFIKFKDYKGKESNNS